MTWTREQINAYYRVKNKTPEYRAKKQARYKKCYDWLDDYKRNRPCTDCGKFWEPCQMDFDHLKDKKFNIAARRHCGVEALKREISKCELVCANCHRLRTNKRKQEQER